MSATDSIQYRIAENIVETMKLIKANGGYKYTVPDCNCAIAAARCERRDPNRPGIFVDIIDSSPVEDQAHTMVEIYHYLVSFYNLHEGDNPNVNDDNKNAVADIVKALKVDVTRGGLAHFTEKGESGNAFDMDTGAPYTYVDVFCKTTVNGTDPYST